MSTISGTDAMARLTQLKACARHLRRMDHARVNIPNQEGGFDRFTPEDIDAAAREYADLLAVIAALSEASAIVRAALEQLLAYPQGMMIPGHDDKGYVLLSWVHTKAKDALAAVTL